MSEDRRFGRVQNAQDRHVSVFIDLSDLVLAAKREVDLLLLPHKSGQAALFKLKAGGIAKSTISVSKVPEDFLLSS